MAMRVPGRISSASLAALAFALAAPAFAAAPVTDEGEIVVTAQKREQNLSDVPAAIQAISGDTLERRGITKLNDLVDFIPGASVVSNAGPGFSTIQIRGVSSGTVGDATVGYYIDDVVFSIPNLQLSPPSRLLDLERTEVLRGPQGTLYGNGAMGGLVRLITAKPNTENWSAKGLGEVSFTESGGTNYNFDGVLNAPLAKDKAGLRISGGYEYLSGFADGAAGKDLNDTRSWNIRGKLLLKPTENLDVTLSIWHIDNKQRYGNNLLTVAPAVVQDPYGVADPRIATVATFYSGSLKWDLGSVALESGTSYIDHKLDIDSVVESVLFGFPVGIRNDSTFKSRSFSQELRLVSQGDSPFKWIIGGIYTNGRILSDIDVNIRGLGDPIPFLTTFGAPLRTKSFAVYGEASYDLFDGKLVPLVGLRYFNDRRSAEGTTGYLGVDTFDSAAQTFDSVNPRFNLTYKPNDKALIYANIAKGFRSGTIQTGAQAQLGQATGVTNTSVLVEPDSLWTYEIGAKLTFGKFYFDGSLYYTDWNNIQIPFNTIGGLPAVVNGGDARIYGIDLGANWRTPLAGLTLQAVANFNTAQFKNVNPQLADSLETAQNGARLPGVPKQNYSFAATYRTAITESLDLNFYGSYSFRDRQQDLASGLQSGRLQIVNLRAGLETNHFRFDIFAENATDERGPVLFTATARQALYPRRIGASVTVKY